MVQIAAERLETSRSLTRKREILEAASRVFRRQGLHATGMRDVAAELGMHVGNLYYYFDNRQALLAFCQQDTLTSLQQLARRVRNLALRTDQQLYLLIVGHVVQLNEGTPGSLAHLEVEALENPWRHKLQRQRDRYERVFRDLIRRGVEGEVFRSVDPKVAAMTILGAVNWTVKWFRPGGGKSATVIGEQCALHLVQGLLVAGATFAPQNRRLTNADA